jgi:signal transduction histidine kinase
MDGVFGELVGLGRLLASAGSPEEMHAALAEAAAKQFGVASAVFRVNSDRLEIVASHGVELTGWSTDADELEALPSQLASISGLGHAQMRMLVVGGDVYGALVLLSSAPIELTEDQYQLVDAMVDLAAAATERAARYGELARSYAELKASREALARSERLRILGQMAAGISHDVKNILNPLGLQLEVVRRRIAKGDLQGAHSTLDNMRDVIHHGVEVVERLRAFSRQAPEVSESVDVARVVATAVELSRPRVALFSGVELVVETIPDLSIRARASELASAMVNLIVNATEAMQDGGTITISAGTTGGEVWIRVADNGPGIPAEIANNVFEPFFTTKKEGTGLGLAMIYAFVQRFSGRVTLETTPGKGSTFTLLFPGG